MTLSTTLTAAESAGFLLHTEFLRRMRHEKIRPNEITFNAAISACEKGRWAA